MISSKPYWDTPLKDEFEVKIVSFTEQDGQYHLTIDRDVIRPEGGGQAGEHGTLWIADLPVNILNTISGKEGTVLVVDSRVESGQSARLVIDMKRRRALMRNHTAEHLFASELKRIYSDLEVGYTWIDQGNGTVEVLGAEFDEEMLFAAEARVQEHIFAEKSVETVIVDATTLSDRVRAREGVKSKHDKIRVVRIDEIDESACSGIHVLNTSDIGIFKIIEYRIEETSAKIDFLTHREAAASLQALFNSALTRKHGFPFEMQQLGPILDKAKTAIHERVEMVELITDLLAGGRGHEYVQEIRFNHYYLPGFDSKDLKNALKSMPEEQKTATLLFAPGLKCNLVFWTTGLENPASYYIADIVRDLDGKGGGSGDSYTGGFATFGEAKALYSEILENLRRTLK